MTEPDDAPGTKRAGAFDVRTVIGVLLGLYGLVLLVMGVFFTSEDELARADGENLNLWTGVALLVTAAVFLLWVRLRPLVVPDRTKPGHDAPGTSSARPR